MQFFPAVMPQGAHFSRPNSMFETADSRAGQDFNDLLFSQMDQPKETGRTAQSDQHQASSGRERPFSEDRDIGNKGADDPVRDPDQCAGAHNSSEADADQADAEGVGQDGAQTAKPAESGHEPAASEEQAAPANGARGQDSCARSAERASDDSGSAGQDGDAPAEAIADNIQALLHGLAEESASGRLDSGTGGIKTRIEAMHELLRQFREADPAERSSLAVALGGQIKALKDDLAALAQTKAASARESGLGKSDQSTTLGERIKALKDDLAALAQTKAVSSKDSGLVKPDEDASGKVLKIEALIERLKVRADQEKSARDLAGRREEAAFAPMGKAGDAPAEASVDAGTRSGSLKISPAAAASTQRTEKDNAAIQGSAVARSAARSDKKRGPGSDIAMRSVSGEKAGSGSVSAQAAQAGRDGSGGRTGLTPDAAEESQGPEARRQEAALSGAEHKAAQASEQTGRQESVVSRNGLPTAKGRDAAQRDAKQPTTQDAVVGKQEGDTSSSGSNRSAKFEAGAQQRDARQGFFTASDREKTSSPTLRPAQSAGGEKTAFESLTQTAAQNSQTSFQQRLESPVSARSAQVYQQVENGAFKNLGQGVKQLVIRLDPADLGQVSVILQVRGKEVQAVLRSSSQEASAALNEQLGQLRSQLEAQGLKVGKLEVQTQLADSQSQSQWQGAQSHNRHQENQELAMSARRWRSLGRVAPDLAQDVHTSPQREKLSRSGLDIFA